MLGVKAGIDPLKLLEILKVSTGSNRALDQYPRSVLKGEFEARFKLSLACKDLRLALQMAKEYNIDMPVVANACAQQFFKAEAEGWGELEHQTVIWLTEREAGVQVRAKK